MLEFIMPNPQKKYFNYNPHHHVKIWLSSNPNVFMNIENQMRLINMRELNPTDTIHLVYDSSLLNKDAIRHFNEFCQEHKITPVDAHEFGPSLNKEHEQRLYQFYNDEITHLKEGGNLAVASDILRWISSVYTKGTYTDFDVPVNTTQLPPYIRIETPLLLNIGSLRTGNVDVILSNNDYIAVVDPKAAKKQLERIQAGLITTLTHYENDFIEKTEKDFGKGGWLNKYLLNFMKNRSESIYIARSKSIFPEGTEKSSREFRKYLNEIMTDAEKFLRFNKNKPTETHEAVIQRLRTELKHQIGFIKWLFFRSEYQEIKHILQQNDDKFVGFLMKKERTLYLKSIVVCTTGTIAIAKFLFNGYVFNSNHFDKHIQPYSFNHYHLKSTFQSKNSIGIHENLWGMIRFLGAEDGKLNDSSWLETGAHLQKTRGQLLEENKKAFEAQLPRMLETAKNDINRHIQELKVNSRGFRGLFFQDRKQEKIKALSEVLACFKEDAFDIGELKAVSNALRSKSKIVYSGYFHHQTQNLIENLRRNCHSAIVFGLSRNRQLMVVPETSFPLKTRISVTK